MAQRIVETFTGQVSTAGQVEFPHLTPREREVLALLSAGARNSEIARTLGLTDKTVRNHVSAILVKLHLPDRTSAALKGREAGLGR